MKLRYKALILSAAIALVACETDFKDKVTDAGFYHSGEADLSTFVAVGNSLTAGYTDNALYKDAQNYSYPNILASRFAFAGGEDFKQPMMDDNYGGLLLNGQKLADTRMVLSFDAEGNANPTNLDAEPTTDITNTLSGPFNNMGVPGAKSYHLVAKGYGNIAGVAAGQANPYFVRFASEPNTSVIADAMALDASFFSLWIGNNDILGYATSGGSGIDQAGNLDPTTYGGNDITDPNVFRLVYQELVGALVADGAKGILSNLPDVTTIPYFNTVPVHSIPMDESTAAMVNGIFGQYNQVLGSLQMAGILSEEEASNRKINFQAGANAPIIVDKDLTDIGAILQGQGLDAQTAGLLSQLRQANSEDLLLLPSMSVLGTLANPNDPMSIMGVAVPLSDELVLTKIEQEKVATATTAYNTTIKALAEANDLAFFDANSMMRQLSEDGVAYDAGVLTADYVTGGAFSLDGVHPTARGYAYIANEMVRIINDKYNAELPNVNIGEFPTVTAHNN